MNTPSSGVEHIMNGLAMVFQSGLKRYVLIPIFINIIVYVLLCMLGYHFIHELITWANHLLPQWLHWLGWIIWPLFILANLVFFVYTFTLFANIIGAPFNSFLSEKIELMKTGKKYEGNNSWHEILKEVPRTMSREWSKLKYYFPRAIILFLLSCIPGVNAISSVLWFIFGSWMMGVQYLDYPMDNHKVSFHEMMKQLRKRSFSTLAFGACALILSFLPFINLIAMPASVIGGTLKWIEDHHPQK